jgi:predicted ABC-type ATPase
MPNLYVIAGCNGSGKTTIAKALLPNYFNCTKFVNADIMAAEMSPGNVASVAITAGKMTLELVNRLFDDGMSFAIETTLSGKVHERIVKKAQERGYYVVLIYVWVRSARVSIARVKQRTFLGGHYVGNDDVIRRYKRGILNLFKIYMDLCNYWVILDNMKPPQKIVAEGTGGIRFNIHINSTWKKIKSSYSEYDAQ